MSLVDTANTPPMFADATPFTMLPYPVGVGVYVISNTIGLVASNTYIPEE